ncbi:MAG: aminopeptidase, partial [Oscillospiraceae bacterium]|nr:aminopeptidase [Oscillospiraceae bacterium]
MSEKEKEKSRVDRLKDSLFYAPQEIIKKVSADHVAAADGYCAGYMAFLDAAKTEREAVAEAVRQAQANGFRPFDRSQKPRPGDKIYYNNRGKALLLAVIGSRPVADGVTIAAAHIDSPRLDLKPNPLYEDHNLAYFDTHYYGGIKKYQWTATPLALHGVVVRADGSAVEITIGEDPGDPVFCVTDLLPHLAAEQMKKPMGESIRGE